MVDPGPGPVVFWSKLTPADQEIQDLCNVVKAQLESESNKTYQEYFAYAYKLLWQFNITTYAVKVYVGKGESYFLKITKPTGGGLINLVSYEGPKGPYDKLPVPEK